MARIGPLTLAWLLCLTATATAQQVPPINLNDRVRIWFLERGRPRLEGRIVHMSDDSLVVALRRGGQTAVEMGETQRVEVRVARGFDHRAARRDALVGALIFAGIGARFFIEGDPDAATVMLVGTPIGAGFGYVLGGKGRVAREALLGGLLVGAGVGTLVGLASYQECRNCFLDFGPGVSAAAGAIVGAAIGTTLGLIVGLTRQSYDWRTAYTSRVNVTARPLPYGRVGIGMRIPIAAHP